jgi:hypothetical protein
MTFVIYLIEAALAVVAGLPFALDFSNSAPRGHDLSARAQWLEYALSLGTPARLAVSTSALALATLYLLGPWLQMAWLSALGRREGLGESLATGARLWWRACLVTLWVSIGVLLGLAPFALAAWGLSRLSAARLNDRVHGLAIACALLPVLPVLIAACAWFDLARARALQEGAWTSAIRSLRTAIQPATIMRALLWSVAGWLLFIVAQVAPLARWGGPPLLMFCLQTAVLMRLFVRSRWLADALTCAEHDDASRASEAS